MPAKITSDTPPRTDAARGALIGSAVRAMNDAISRRVDASAAARAGDYAGAATHYAAAASHYAAAAREWRAAGDAGSALIMDRAAAHSDALRGRVLFQSVAALARVPQEPRPVGLRVSHSGNAVSIAPVSGVGAAWLEESVDTPASARDGASILADYVPALHIVAAAITAGVGVEVAPPTD